MLAEFCSLVTYERLYVETEPCFGAGRLIRFLSWSGSRGGLRWSWQRRAVSGPVLMSRRRTWEQVTALLTGVRRCSEIVYLGYFVKKCLSKGNSSSLEQCCESFVRFTRTCLMLPNPIRKKSRGFCCGSYLP
jgi:hypothetical protein